MKIQRKSTCCFNSSFNLQVVHFDNFCSVLQRKPSKINLLAVLSTMTFSVRFVSSVILLSVCLLPTIFGSALPEIFGGWSRGNDGGDGSSTVFSATDFLQRAYRIQELQTEYHSDYSLLRCKSTPFLSFFFFWGEG